MRSAVAGAAAAVVLALGVPMAAPASDSPPWLFLDAKRLDGGTGIVVCAELPPAPSAEPLPRSTVDRPDDVGCPQVHLLYVLPSDGTDLGRDHGGALAGSFLSVDAWLRAQTGGAGLRLDTWEGRVDVTFVRLDRTDADLASYGAWLRDELEKEVRRAGFDEPYKLYAVYYEGTSKHSCGGAAWPPAIVGTVGAMYLQGRPPGAPPCNSNPLVGPGDPPAYFEFGMLHEVVHTLGFAPPCAPNHNWGGHVNDSNHDLMWAADLGEENPLPWWPEVLDAGLDDYYNHPDPTCLDLARSAWLDPAPPLGELPPDWREFTYDL